MTRVRVGVSSPFQSREDASIATEEAATSKAVEESHEASNKNECPEVAEETHAERLKFEAIREKQRKDLWANLEPEMRDLRDNHECARDAERQCNR